MIAEILCIGTEVLIGDIVNTNAAYLSKRLSESGFDVLYHSVCGDNPKRLAQCLEIALSRSELVVTTGGLGPTYDDLSLKVCAEKFGFELVKSEDVLAFLREYYEKSGRVMTQSIEKQAFVPKGAKVFINNCGTAPGICMEKDGKCIVMMPGPPREMKPMLEESVLPYLMKYSKGVLVSSNVNILGVGESYVENKLFDLMSTSKNPTVAPYIDDGEVRLRVTAVAKSSQQARELIDPVILQIKNEIGEYVYDIDSLSLEHSLVKILKQKKLTISTAESCTGGLVSQLITEVPGSSEVFGFGVCSYANKAKMDILGVKEKTLATYGAVSEETAKEMALGIKKLSGSDIAISLTGLAGPSGGTEQKPIGLVYMGVAVKNTVYAKKLLTSQHNKPSRSYIRMVSAKNALKTAIDEALRF